MTRDDADNALRQALIDHASAYNLDEDDELLSEFAIICHWQRVEADGKSRYTTHYHQPIVPHHIAIGLFRAGGIIAEQSEDDD